MNLLAFLLSLISSISTLFGIIFIYKSDDNIVSNCLYFTSGVMITVSIIDLIPESFKLFRTNIKLIPTILFILIFINIGCLISKYIDNKTNNDNSLYQVGIISMIAIIIHNIPEGIITYITANKNLKLGIMLTISIMLHNIPEGISIAIPIYHGTKNKRKAIIYTLIAGFSELFGTIIAFILLSSFINNFILACILSITAGIMIYISIFELIKEGRHYNNKFKTIFLLIGIIIVILTQIIINNLL